MKRRNWLIAAVTLLLSVALLDTAAWLVATNTLLQTIEAWAAQQRAGGLDVTVGEPSAGGWPLAATQHFVARLGPAGTPAGLVVAATLTSGVSWARPALVRTEIEEARLSAPGAATLTATAAGWVVDMRLADLRAGAPGRATMTASLLRLAWAGHAAAIASLAGAASQEPAGIRLALLARDIDLGRSGLTLPTALGEAVRSLQFDGVLHGGLPAAAATAEASARAWREAGGELSVDRLAVSYGAFDAMFAGRFGLDEALWPDGSGVVTARGLVPLLGALGSSGVIPAHSGQAAAGILALLGEAPDGGVEIPVNLRDGRVVLAGFPVAHLPRIGQ